MQLTAEFKNSLAKSVLAVLFFIVIYLALVAFAIGLTIACGFLGIGLMAYHISFFTIALGIGIISTGAMVLIFVLKFIFKKSEKVQEGNHQIDRNQEPKLFALIDEVAQEVGTSKPKKVFLSHDVNASVFYNSSFWSMFLPTKKNLLIGVGLLNTLNRGEFKAVLAHEFGHFSQKSMKVGSFVYHVNQVIFNMLYDNESFENGAASWARASGYFSFFVVIAFKIVRMIQKILQGVYGIINTSYLKLSRAMEFQADEIATTVAGKSNLSKALLRLGMAEFSFTSVLNYYGAQVSKNIVSSNLYDDQHALMGFLSRQNQIQLINGLPEVQLRDLNRFNKSKLHFEDLWASHPSIEDRISSIEKKGLARADQEDTGSARTYLSDFDETTKVFSEKIFDSAQYTGEIRSIDSREFLGNYRVEADKISFDPIYNSYYDYKTPEIFDLEAVDNGDGRHLSFDVLFSGEQVEASLEATALEGDIETIRQIAFGQTGIKSYEYDGTRYKAKKSTELLKRLHGELEELKEKSKQNDVDIYKFFARKATESKELGKLNSLYAELFAYSTEAEKYMEQYNGLIESSQFMQIQTPFEEIERKMGAFKGREESLKQAYAQLYEELKSDDRTIHLDHDKISKYLSRDWSYFDGEAYREHSLELLHTALPYFVQLVELKFFIHKSSILNFQKELIKADLNQN